MNIFKKRPLGLILCVFLCGFALFTILPELYSLIIASLSLIAFILCFFIKPINKTIFKILFLTIFIAILLSFCYFTYIFYPSDYFDQEAEIVGTVTDILEKDTGFTVVDLQIDSINGNKENYKTKLYYYHSSDGMNLKAGNRILVNSTLKKFDADGDFNNQAYHKIGRASCRERVCLSV